VKGIQAVHLISTVTVCHGLFCGPSTSCFSQVIPARSAFFKPTTFHHFNFATFHHFAFHSFLKYGPIFFQILWEGVGNVMGKQSKDGFSKIIKISSR
jgi:hypothetical protein